MRENSPPSWGQLVTMAGRSLLVGAVGGAVGGGLLFFVFGFIGFTGAPLLSRVANGWRALLDHGLGKGLVVGAGIAVSLMALVTIWSKFARRIDPGTLRPWLAVLGASMVVVFNLEWLRTAAGWDWAGIATVAGMSLMVWIVVWSVAPWVLRDLGDSAVVTS